MTFVYRSYTWLEKWMEHYGRELGRENLYIFSHGGDPKHDAICEGSSVITVPREFNVQFNMAKGSAFTGLTKALLGFHQVVLMTDVDEYIAIHPSAGKSLAEYLLEDVTEEVSAPLGLNILRQSEEPADWSKPLLAQADYLALHNHYTKPAILRRDFEFGTGSHGIREKPFVLDPYLILFHAKYADLTVVREFVDEFEVDRQALSNALRGNTTAYISPVRQAGWEEGALAEFNRWNAQSLIPTENWLSEMQKRINRRGFTKDRHGVYRWRAMRGTACKVEVPEEVKNLV